MKWPNRAVVRQQLVMSFSMAALVVVGSVFVHGWSTAAMKPTIVTFAIVWCAIDLVLLIAAMLRRIMTTRGGSS